ncbi:TPA: EAL domain-containing protein [Clostridioides difficile]
MKKRLIGLLGIIIIISVLIWISGKNKPIGNPVEERNKIKLTIAGDKDFPPYEFIDNKNKYKGFNVDIMRAIEKVMDIEIELIPMRWTDVIIALENKEVDAIQGMSKTPSREEKYLFTQSTIINSHAIFIKKDINYIKSIDDLKGVRVSYQIGDSNEERIKEIPFAIMVPRYNQMEAIQALLDGEADAFIGNKIMAKYYLNKMKSANKIKIVGEALSETAYGPATLAENKLVYTILEQGLEKIKKNGTYDKIYERWFGSQLSFSKHMIRLYMKQIIGVGAFIIIVLLILSIWNQKLKTEVSKRTKELEVANKNLKSQQDSIYSLAYFDSVTCLPNRLYFIEELKETIGNIDDERIAVLYLDLDRFKHINDTLGHNIGDNILRLVGARLRKLIDEGDLLSRGVGDRYLILLKNIENEREAISIAEKIIKDFTEVFLVNNYELYLTMSIGIAIYPEGGKNSVSLIKNAEIALYKAKDMGGNSYFKYDKKIEKDEYENLMLLNELRQAVINEEFVLYYQPKINIQTEEIIGMEALIRWESPKRGLVFPDKFIPLAEDTGLIVSIGEWVLKEACIQNKKWIDMGYKPRRISVNISARQFQHYNFLDTVSRILKETGLEVKNLGLEITETTVISDIKYTIDVLDKLKELGVFIVMDDFGTGYSSLSYLKEMNIDEIKIDRGFVWNLEDDEKNRAISKTIILLAKQFSILVTAEGVETKEQLNILKSFGCDKAQGYYFSKPIPAEEFETLLD